MLYLIKILYELFLMPPGIYTVLFFILGILIYKQRARYSRILLIAGVVFYLCNIPLVSDSLIRSLESKHTPPAHINGDVIIMLGGGATLDTPNIEGLGHLSGFAANRLLTCAQLYQKLKVPIILSGGKVYAFTGNESEIAKRILKGLGVPEEDIIIENKSLNTTQNARYANQLVEQHGFQAPILITSAFHMERALLQFRKAELQVTAFPTDYLANVHNTMDLYDFLPSADALLKMKIALKEYIGIFAVRWW